MMMMISHPPTQTLQANARGDVSDSMSLSVCSPQPLTTLVCEYLCDHAHLLVNPDHPETLTLRNDVSVPQPVAQKLFHLLRTYTFPWPDWNHNCSTIDLVSTHYFLPLFPPDRCRLADITLNLVRTDLESAVTVLRHWLRHRPRKLHVRLNSVLAKFLWEDSVHAKFLWEVIKDKGVSLQSLVFRPVGGDQASFWEAAYSLPAANLKSLTIENVKLSREALESLLTPLPNLESLDLSVCEVESLGFLRLVPSLTSLVLHGLRVTADTEDEYVDSLTTLKQIRHLDISGHVPMVTGVEFHQPSLSLFRVVSGLPSLASLDISYTKFYQLQKGEMDEWAEISTKYSSDVLCKSSTVPGLLGLKQPLKFLGLVCDGLPIDTSSPEVNIPAVKVAGIGGLEQLLLACSVYQQRQGYITKVVDELYQLTRTYDMDLPPAYETKVLPVIVRVMRTAITYDTVTIETFTKCFAIYCCIYHYHEVSIHLRLKLEVSELVFKFLLMNPEKNCRYLARNIREVIDIDDMNFNYKKIVQSLLLLLADRYCRCRFEAVWERECLLYVLSLLKRHARVFHDHKPVLGQLGVFRTCLNLLDDVRRNGIQLVDDVVYSTWNVMWSSTDVQPNNCVLFVSSGGLDKIVMFLTALKEEGLNVPGDVFPRSTISPGSWFDWSPSSSNIRLFIAILGVLSNICEVEEMADVVIRHEIAQILWHYLDDNNRPEVRDVEDLRFLFELDFNIVEIFALLIPRMRVHGLDSGEDPKFPVPTILSYMTYRITNHWNIGWSRNVSYRSLEPFYRMLKEDDEELLYFSCWSIGNLIYHKPDKYIPMFREEGGEGEMRRLLTGKLRHSQTDLCYQLRRLIEEVLHKITLPHPLPY